MLIWADDIGYNENNEIVAFISYNRDKSAMIVKVRGGVATDKYFVESSVTSPGMAEAFDTARKLAEVTYRLIRNQPDMEAAQVALRAYARMKGGNWWEGG